jgi:hypothetical protein
MHSQTRRPVRLARAALRFPQLFRSIPYFRYLPVLTVFSPPFRQVFQTKSVCALSRL